MNSLLLGLNDKTELLNTTPGFLLIDHGPLCDLFAQRFKRAKHFHPEDDSINPLDGITEDRARDLADILYSYKDSGKDTLTVRNGKRALMHALAKGKRLDELEFDTSDSGKEAQATVDDIMFSPLLRKCLTTTNFAIRHGNPPTSVIAWVDPKRIGRFNAFFIASMLAIRHPGQIIISDFGRYARNFHLQLMDENRLSIGLNRLSELDEDMRESVLLFEEKSGRRCTRKDAETLADYSGWGRSTNEYLAIVGRAMGQ